MTHQDDFNRAFDRAVAASGLSRAEFSLALGFSQSALSQVRNGHAKSITADMAGRIEVYLDHPGLAEMLLVLQARIDAERMVAHHRAMTRLRVRAGR